MLFQSKEEKKNMLRRTCFIVPTFNKKIPNKIGNGIDVFGKNTLKRTDNGWRAAIADKSIESKVDGKHIFCVRIDNPGKSSHIKIGFTPLETFDSTKEALFGWDGFGGISIFLHNGDFCSSANFDKIIDAEISRKAKEIISILTINGTKKEIRFLCDGNESKTTDVSQHVNKNKLFPAICLRDRNQQVTTIPIDEIKTRTPEIENLIKEYRKQQNNNKNNSQSVGVVASSPSPSSMIQLQKELAELLQEKAALSAPNHVRAELTKKHQRQPQKEKENSIPIPASKGIDVQTISQHLRQIIREELQKPIERLEEQLKQQRNDFLKLLLETKEKKTAATPQPRSASCATRTRQRKTKE